ncbi:MAG: hypothetical protein U0U66_00015 [Cytophagaceae bacterium]
MTKRYFALFIGTILLLSGCDDSGSESNKIGFPDSLRIITDSSYFVQYPATIQRLWVNDSATFRNVNIGNTKSSIVELEAELIETTPDSITYSLDIDGVESGDFTYVFDKAGIVSSIDIYIYCKSAAKRSDYAKSIQDFYVRKTGSSWESNKLASPAAGISIEMKEIGNSKVNDLNIIIKKSPSNI